MMGTDSIIFCQPNAIDKKSPGPLKRRKKYGDA
jgi:hypothetical protein